MEYLIKIEERIISINCEKFILDCDAAYLYGVETRDINKAVKNNPEKFPYGYCVELNSDQKNELVEKFHRLSNLKFSRVNPKAFTEKGLYMLATIIKSEIATKTTIEIIETFAKLREISRNLSDINEVGTKSEKLLAKSAKILNQIVNDGLKLKESETSVEINLALLKIKKTVRRR